MRSTKSVAGLVSALIASVFFMAFGGTASATTVTPAESWTAEGFREIAFVNSATVLVLPFKIENFASQALCTAALIAQNSLVPGANLKGYGTSQKVIAECEQVK